MTQLLPIKDFVPFCVDRLALIRRSREQSWLRKATQETPKKAKTSPTKKKSLPKVDLPPGLSAEQQAMILKVINQKR